MKTANNAAIKAYLIRGAFYLLLLIVVCAIPFALARSSSRETTRRGVANLASHANMAVKFAVASPASGAAQATKLSGAHFKAASQSNAGSPLLPYDVRGVPDVPTGSPTCTPGGTPGPWMAASPYPTTIGRYGFAQTATYLYVFGGVSDGTRVNAVNRLNLATGMWESRAPMPFTSEAPTCALMEDTGIVYCAEGDTGNSFASYNIATDNWLQQRSVGI